MKSTGSFLKIKFRKTSRSLSVSLQIKLISDSLMVFVETFLQVYERNKTHALFEWFNDLAKEYSGNVNGQFNVETQPYNIINSRATIIDQKNPLVATDPTLNKKNLLNDTEIKTLHTFFHEKLVLKADLKDSLKVLSDLFFDMKLPPLLERRIIESFLYASETVSD